MIGTHKRAGRCYCLLRCLRAFVLFLRAFPFLWCGVLSQHFILSQHFAVCVLFILRSPHGFWCGGVRHICAARTSRFHVVQTRTRGGWFFFFSLLVHIGNGPGFVLSWNSPLPPLSLSLSQLTQVTVQEEKPMEFWKYGVLRKTW